MPVTLPRTFVMIVAQHLVHATATGFRRVYIAADSICIPAAPPGRKVIKYHINARSCAAEHPNTITYPVAPPAVNVKNNVAIIDPTYTAVNGNRSGTSMPIKCSYGPLRIANDPMNVRLPQVKDKANFCGRMYIIGKPTAKASAKNSADSINRAQNICG